MPRSKARRRIARCRSKGMSSPKLCHRPEADRGQVEAAAAGAPVGHGVVAVVGCAVAHGSIVPGRARRTGVQGNRIPAASRWDRTPHTPPRSPDAPCSCRRRPRARVVPASSPEPPAASAGARPNRRPGSPAYLARDAQNIADAYGRQTAPDGQLTPAYGLANAQHIGPAYEAQLLAQAATPDAAGADAGPSPCPGWNSGNPYRQAWNGTRGHDHAGAFTNRYGALLRGDVFAPMAGAHDPYTGAAADGPLPGRRDHHRVGAGQRADVLVAGRGPRRARLRRPHLRRAGPGHQRDPAAPGRDRGPAVLRPRRPAGARRADARARASRRSRRRTSSTAPRTRSTSSCRRRRSATRTPAPAARR